MVLPRYNLQVRAADARMLSTLTDIQGSRGVYCDYTGRLDILYLGEAQGDGSGCVRKGSDGRFRGRKARRTRLAGGAGAQDDAIDSLFIFHIKDVISGAELICGRVAFLGNFMLVLTTALKLGLAY